MTKTILPLLKAIRRDVRGATAIEYGMLVSMLGLLLYASSGFAGTSVINMWETVSSKSSTVLNGSAS